MIKSALILIAVTLASAWLIAVTLRRPDRIERCAVAPVECNR